MAAARWPQNYGIMPRARRYDFSDIFPSAVTVVNCTVAYDAAVRKGASSTSLKITPSVGGGTAVVSKNITAVMPLTLKEGLARFRLYWPGKSGNHSIQLTISAGTDGTNAARYAYNSNILREGWNYLWLPLNNRDPTHKPSGYTTSASGTDYDYTAVANFLGITITPSGSFTPDDVLWLDTIDVGSKCRPKIILGFDDITASVVDYALPVIDGYGWTAYVALSNVYTTPTVIDSVIPLKAAGWHALNHSYDHISYETLGAAAAAADYLRNRQWLAEQGFFSGQPAVTRDFLAYAENATNASVASALAAAGCVSARESRNVFNLTDEFGVDNPLRMGSLSMGSATSLAYAKGIVNSLIMQGGSLFLYGHSLVVAGPSSTQWTISDFTDLMTHIRGLEQLGLVDVVSWADWYTGLTQPALVA